MKSLKLKGLNELNSIWQFITLFISVGINLLLVYIYTIFKKFWTISFYYKLFA